MIQKAESLKPCPCGSGVNYESCCLPVIKGDVKADTSEQLMRARYTAFVADEIDFIMSTHHPEKVKEIDRAGVEDWAKNSQWHGLEVLDSQDGDEEGVVEFIAKYTQDGKTYNHRESSLFKKQDGNWYFYDIQKNQPIKKDNKIGRNDPCFCGSGKKFKKCHGHSKAA